MGVIFTSKHLIWQMKQCLHIHSQIMRYHTGNVHCNVVPNFQAEIFLTKKQMISIPTQGLHLIARCTIHGRIPITDKKFCRKCKQDTDSKQSTKIYNGKEIVIIETNISNLHRRFYIPEIQKLAFHIPHVQILGTNNFGDSRRIAFKRRK